MQRSATEDLRRWSHSAGRRPLVLRGARQTGKSWLIANFPERLPSDLVVVNFERDPALAACFQPSVPQQVLHILAARLRRTIVPGRTVLFLDEIQAAPGLLGKLRWFAEELPALHVVAAGSLLDVALADAGTSVPVGRLTYGHLEPMTFAEFLLANDEGRLLQAITAATFAAPLPIALHERAEELVRDYLCVGGMPAAVACWAERRSPAEVADLHRDLWQTMRDDLAKYRGTMPLARLEQVFAALPRLVGRKFQPAQVDRGVRSVVLRDAFRLLCDARVATPVQSTAANGVPLGAEVDERYQKVCLLDTGLLATAIGIDPGTWLGAEGARTVYEGPLAEQFVGQELRACRPFGEAPRLFTWVRQARGSNAEVDYVVQHGTRVVPVEVKAGAPGRLRSLHSMVFEKGLDLAVRCGPGPLQLRLVQTALPIGPPRRFRLLSVPFCMVGQLPRLLHEASG